MKKFLCLFSALTLVLTSCSNDDTPNDNQFLLKKMVETYEDGSTITLNYTYEGNKLVSATDGAGEGTVYWTYNQDLITKMEIKLSDGAILQQNAYSYDSNKRLSIFLRIDPVEKTGFREVYTYNGDNTISVKSYTGDDKTQIDLDGTAVITLVDGEVAKIVSTYGVDFAYTYDTKNNPEKSVQGLDKISFADGEASGILHNIITQKKDDDPAKTAEITYNADNFPIKSIDNFEGEVVTTEYFY